MAITKERKVELVQRYVELIRKSEGLFLVEYSGLNMKGMDPLRRKVREVSGELHVVKNTLALQALKQVGWSAPEGWLNRSTAIGFAFKDVPGLAKVMTNYAKENDFVKVKGGLLGGQQLSPKEVATLAELPPLAVVRAQLLGLLSAPATRLAGVIAGGVRQVVNVVKAYADKKEEAPVAA